MRGIDQMTDDQLDVMANSLANEIDKLCDDQPMAVVLMALGRMLAKGMRSVHNGDRLTAVNNFCEWLTVMVQIDERQTTDARH